jgi:hypothetical protein
MGGKLKALNGLILKGQGMRIGGIVGVCEEGRWVMV